MNKIIQNEKLSKAIIDALEKFYINDYNDFFKESSNNNISVHEIAISCKIGFYIFNSLKDENFFEGEYKDFSVDMEYNKMGMELIKKELSGITERCNNQSDHIRPDIIIHKRKHPGRENNFCVFEIKKGNLSPCDIAKLEGLTNQNNVNFQYQYGIGLSNFGKEKAKISIFIDGEKKQDFYFYNKT